MSFKGGAQFLPNITLEQAKELIQKLQRKLDDAVMQKFHAQSIAFDLMFPDKKTGEIEELKAFAFYWKEELKKAIDKRDKLSQQLQESVAENHLLRTQLKKYQKEE